MTASEPSEPAAFASTVTGRTSLDLLVVASTIDPERRPLLNRLDIFFVPTDFSRRSVWGFSWILPSGARVAPATREAPVCWTYQDDEAQPVYGWSRRSSAPAGSGGNRSARRRLPASAVWHSEIQTLAVADNGNSIGGAHHPAGSTRESAFFLSRPTARRVPQVKCFLLSKAFSKGDQS